MYDSVHTYGQDSQKSSDSLEMKLQKVVNHQ